MSLTNSRSTVQSRSTRLNPNSKGGSRLLNPNSNGGSRLLDPNSNGGSRLLDPNPNGGSRLLDPNSKGRLYPEPEPEPESNYPLNNQGRSLLRDMQDRSNVRKSFVNQSRRSQDQLMSGMKSLKLSPYGEGNILKTKTQELDQDHQDSYTSLFDKVTANDPIRPHDLQKALAHISSELRILMDYAPEMFENIISHHYESLDKTTMRIEDQKTGLNISFVVNPNSSPDVLTSAIHRAIQDLKEQIP